LKVWLIQHGEPLPLAPTGSVFRTARLAKELAGRGHDVTYWCSSLYHHKKTLYCEETTVMEADGYRLHVLHAGSYTSNHSLGRWQHHRRMARLFAQDAATKEKPDIIVAGLPVHYCAFEAVRFGKQHGIPVVVDIRDAWPDLFLMVFPRGLRWLGRMMFARDFAVARTAMAEATTLVSMMTQLLDWGLERYAGRPRAGDDRVYLIGGDDVSVPSSDPATLFPQLAGRVKGRLVVNYIGSFSYLNHPMVLVEAAKAVKAMGHDDDVLFVLAGMGDFHARCVEAARGLNNVVFPGWIDNAGIAALNSMSDLGVIPSFEEFSFPNKAFSYLGGGLPIMSSEHGDLSALLEKYRAGYHFEMSDPAGLAQQIVALSKLDSEEYGKLKANARSLFHDHLRADVIYRQFADYVQEMAHKHGNGRAGGARDTSRERG